MGWVTLTLRKQTLKACISDSQFRDIQLSRETRSIERHLAYDKSCYNSEKQRELADAKSAYMDIRNKRPSIDSEEYQQWKVEYAEAQEDYQAKKQDIQDYYDDLMEEIELEAKEEQDRIEDEKTTLEAELQAMQSELEAVSEQIKTDIDSSKITLS